MSSKLRKHRIIAPRLANGESRVGFGHGLPKEIKEGLRAIALREHQSMSWVMEQVIIRFFGLPQPEYIFRKEHETNKKTGTLSDRLGTPKVVGFRAKSTKAS